MLQLPCHQDSGWNLHPAGLSFVITATQPTTQANSWWFQLGSSKEKLPVLQSSFPTFLGLFWYMRAGIPNSELSHMYSKAHSSQSDAASVAAIPVSVPHSLQRTMFLTTLLCRPALSPKELVAVHSSWNHTQTLQVQTCRNKSRSTTT